MEAFSPLSIALTEEPYRGPIVSWGPADPYMKAEYASRLPQEKEDKYLILRTELLMCLFGKQKRKTVVRD